MISIYAPRQCRLPQKLFVQGVLAAAAKKMGQRLVVHKTPQDLKDHGLRSSHFNHTYIVFFSLFGRTGLHRKLMTIWLWLATCLRGRAEMRVHGQPLNFVTDLKKKHQSLSVVSPSHFTLHGPACQIWVQVHGRTQVPGAGTHWLSQFGCTVISNSKSVFGISRKKHIFYTIRSQKNKEGRRVTGRVHCFRSAT